MIGFADICLKYNLTAKSFKGKIHMEALNLAELSDKRQQMKSRIREIDIALNDTKGMPKREQQNLADERYYTSLASDTIYSEIIKRKRKGTEVSMKALNHGGVYSDIRYDTPKVGTGFRGYSGITL